MSVVINANDSRCCSAEPLGIVTVTLDEADLFGVTAHALT